ALPPFPLHLPSEEECGMVARLHLQLRLGAVEEAPGVHRGEGDLHPPLHRPTRASLHLTSSRSHSSLPCVCMRGHVILRHLRVLELL
ncbi:hypothetical protein PENTCL1PPCAC_1200, partial [Pristionchus entomophagus]